MRAKEDGTQGREIKQLPASSSVGPFIVSTCPGAPHPPAQLLRSLTYEYSCAQGGHHMVGSQN